MDQIDYSDMLIDELLERGLAPLDLIVVFAEEFLENFETQV